ncbi:CPBP family intramembrane metalloprotease [Paenibacillus polygoni]|uniref:CPBP family intramembrane metalloprotease n=1 Tax=Paenibacillus polygoni TaxID=3050112 RepID=A0ABY8X030_9BACL|nr:CPBP family intramembrane glutamic endopeptidase [Paenibacillus polygoni]WIV18755.1 CPBP family intramembrane metalloprotease [Paenibacillus polygoni]
MRTNKRIILSIIGLELLLMVFFTANGAFVSITSPERPLLQFIGVIPLALGILIYLLVGNKWKHYFFTSQSSAKKALLYSLPLILVLILIAYGNNGLNTSSLPDLFMMLLIQILVIGLVEEMFFRGFMLRLLLSKGFRVAVFTTSFLFAITHSLQLIGGQSLIDTFFQIIYAFIVGLVLSLLIVHRQSIVIPILFHGLNNFLQFMGNSIGNVNEPAAIEYLIIGIMLVYSIYLWRSMAAKTKNVSDIPDTRNVNV